MEFGARALGNRSILANPCFKDMKEIINSKIKRRENFRPFAPSVIAEKKGEWFKENKSNPYMSSVEDIIPNKIDKNFDDFINELIDTVIEELKVGENFSFAASKLFNLIEADKIKGFQKILPQTLFDPDFIFIQRKILGFLLFFKSINASIPILNIIKEYNKKLQNG